MPWRKVATYFIWNILFDLNAIFYTNRLSPFITGPGESTAQDLASLCLVVFYDTDKY